MKAVSFRVWNTKYIGGRRIRTTNIMKTIIELPESFNDFATIFVNSQKEKIDDKKEELITYFMNKGYQENEVNLTLLIEQNRHYLTISADLIAKCDETERSEYINNSINYSKKNSSNTKETNAAIEKIQLHLNSEKEKKEKIEKEKKQYEDFCKENLRMWAYENGSELVKARIQENMNWFDLANTEYFNSILPDGCVSLDGPNADWEIKNATLEQIKALQDFRNSIFPNPFYGQHEVIERIKESQKNPAPGVIQGSIKLMRYKYEGSHHADVIQFQMRSLSGNTKTFEKILDTEDIENED